MTDFAITVRDRAVTVDRRPTVVVSGSVNVYTMSVSLDDAWDGYTCRAVFRCGFELREALIVDGACAVPWEALVANGSLYIGVHGINGDKRMPTCWTPERIYVAPGTVTADSSQDPSPTVFEELVAQTADNRAAAEAARDAAESAKQGTAADRLVVADDKTNVAADREVVESVAQQVANNATRAENAANAAVDAAIEAAKSETAAKDASAQAGMDAEQTAQDREATDASKLAAETAKNEAQAAQAAAEKAAQAAAAHDIVLQTGLTAIQQLAARSNIDAQKQAWETTSGYIANCTDANAGTCYPTIYGKSVQDGTPTPEAPVAVQNALTDAWELRRSGKNVCGGDYLKALFLKTSNRYSAVTFDGKDCVRVDAISIWNYVFTSFKPNTQYTFIFNIYNNNPTTSSYFGYVVYSDGTGKYFPASPSTQWATVVFTSEAGKTVVGFCKGGYGAQGYYDIQNCGIFEGVVALSDFAPYTAQTIQFTALSDGLPGIKLGATVPAALQGRKGLWYDGADWWIGNWMDADSGKVGVNVYAKVYTGSNATWIEGGVVTNPVNKYFTDVLTVNTGVLDARALAMCSHFQNLNIYENDIVGFHYAGPISGNHVRFRVPQQTAAEFNAWLAAQYAAGTPVTVYYVTATETVTDIPSDALSALRSLTTLDGTNNIMVDGSTVQPWLSVKYRQDLQKYVKDKLASIQAAIISLGGNI